MQIHYLLLFLVVVWVVFLCLLCFVFVVVVFLSVFIAVQQLTVWLIMSSTNSSSAKQFVMANYSDIYVFLIF